MDRPFKLRNGTYLITTEAPGGIYNSAQLKKIGELSEGDVAIVKATEDQRLALFVPEAKLAHVVAELGAIGLGTRNYQSGVHQPVSCVGELCPHHKQNAWGTALDLTQELTGATSKTPIRIGINGCERACVPTHTLDISIIGDEAGYRINLGGKQTQLPELASYVAEGVPAADLPKLIARVVSLADEICGEDETITDAIAREGLGRFAEVLAPYSQDAGGGLDFGSTDEPMDGSMAENSGNEEVAEDFADDGAVALNDDLQIVEEDAEGSENGGDAMDELSNDDFAVTDEAPADGGILDEGLDDQVHDYSSEGAPLSSEEGDLLAEEFGGSDEQEDDTLTVSGSDDEIEEFDDIAINPTSKTSGRGVDAAPGLSANADEGEASDLDDLSPTADDAALTENESLDEVGLLDDSLDEGPPVKKLAAAPRVPVKSPKKDKADFVDLDEESLAEAELSAAMDQQALVNEEMEDSGAMSAAAEGESALREVETAFAEEDMDDLSPSEVAAGRDDEFTEGTNDEDLAFDDEQMMIDDLNDLNSTGTARSPSRFPIETNRPTAAKSGSSTNLWTLSGFDVTDGGISLKFGIGASVNVEFNVCGRGETKVLEMAGQNIEIFNAGNGLKVSANGISVFVPNRAKAA